MNESINKMLEGNSAIKQAENALKSLNDIAIPRMPIYEPIKMPVNPNLASEFHHRLINWINDFHKTLDEDHEAGVRLVNFGQSITFHIENISYWNPSLISFIGKTEDGEPVELIQHISQISILLLKMKRITKAEPKRPIGFTNWEEYEKQK